MIIAAIDLGDVRSGVAVCDKGQILASPVCTITERNTEKRLEKIASKVKELKPELIIVGNPKNMDGSEGFRAVACQQFAKTLQEATDIPVKMWDERCTTMVAATYLNETNTRGKKRKAVIDNVAATIILQDFMDSLKK